MDWDHDGGPTASSPVTADDIRDLLAGGGLTNTELAAGIDAAKIGAGSVGNTEFGYLDGVSSAIQSQLNGKAPITHSHSPTGISTNWGSWQQGASGVSLAANTWTAIPFEIARRANPGLHSITVNPTQFAAPTTGTYLVSLRVYFGPPTSGDRAGYVGITVNNASPANQAALVARSAVLDPSRGFGHLNVMEILALSAGDILRCWALSQSAGGSTNGAETHFTMALIGA